METRICFTTLFITSCSLPHLYIYTLSYTDPLKLITSLTKAIAAICLKAHKRKPWLLSPWQGPKPPRRTTSTTMTTTTTTKSPPPLPLPPRLPRWPHLRNHHSGGLSVSGRGLPGDGWPRSRTRRSVSACGSGLMTRPRKPRGPTMRLQGRCAARTLAPTSRQPHPQRILIIVTNRTRYHHLLVGTLHRVTMLGMAWASRRSRPSWARTYKASLQGARRASRRKAGSVTTSLSPAYSTSGDTINTKTLATSRT